jgi:hypothetical protein
MSEWHVTEVLFAVWVVLRATRIPNFVRIRRSEKEAKGGDQ